MKPFSYFQPTDIRFGSGRIREVGEIVRSFGARCLMVTTANTGDLAAIFARIRGILEAAGVAVAHFDGVIPNPTTDCITAGADMAKAFGAQVVLGVGGGSSMDAAKAIAVEATHPGTSWDYLFFREAKPTDKTLPVVAVSTTSGTGSHVTQVAVVTHTATKTKSAIYNSIVYPRVSIVDPELVLTAPPHVTACTGFDVFCHAFESYIHVGGSPYTDLLAVEAMRLAANHLPAAVDDGSNLVAREAMAWADTLAGLCIANAGVTLPHGIGMTIGGQCPQVAHGEALAVIYPEFTRFTYASAEAKFATMGRLFNPALVREPDHVAAAESCAAIDAFLKRINLWLSLKGLGVTPEDVLAIADNSRVLPDYKNNPRIASRDEIFAILQASYDRESAHQPV
ncbi:MAG: iron-containing alcohol dehydrogenase [Anaerolineae bacterium]|nr:iron-containing alcohol dehydrogenase [Anaerolineae bacterium]